MNTLVEPGQAGAAALALAQRVCAVAQRATQHALVDGAADERGWVATERGQSTIAASADAAEGLAAFREKRDPRWTGC